MQVSVENTEGLNRLVRVNILETTITEKIDQKLKELVRTANTPGFRRGKVPLKIIRQRFAEGVRMEILNDTLEESFKIVLQDHDLQPIAKPQIEITDDKTGFGYTATFEVFPEIDLSQIASLSIRLPHATIASTDIDNMIETLRARQVRSVAVERAAKNDDTVELSVINSVADAPPIDETIGNLHIHKGITRILIGSNKNPTLEHALVAAKVGDERIVTLESKAPEVVNDANAADQDTPHEAATGTTGGETQQTTLTFLVDAIKEWRLPEVDASFIIDYGIADGTMESFRADLLQYMEQQRTERIVRISAAQVMEAIATLPLEIPNTMLKERIQLIYQDVNARKKQANQEEQEWVDNIDTEVVEKTARRLVARDLIMSNIAEVAKIRLDEGLMNDAIKQEASLYIDKETAERMIHSNPEKHNEIAAQVFQQQIIAWIIAQAEIVEVTLSFDRLMSFDPMAESPYAEAITALPEAETGGDAVVTEATDENHLPSNSDEASTANQPPASA